MEKKCNFLIILLKSIRFHNICIILRSVMILLIFFMTQVFDNNTYATELQQVTVKGTVTDQQGAPIIGVTVLVKGTTIGTITDKAGKYTVTNVPQDAILIFSFVGMTTQEIPLNGRTSIDVVLKEKATGLDEVVVIGYGTQSKRNLTGSVTKVDISKAENLPNTNVSQILRGSVAGVQITATGRPGQDGSMLIRGPRSLSASNNPLIVLDGIIFSGSMSDINPGDIQSLEVLKDASSASIYGSRAANGVILITSKKGTTEKPNIKFNIFNGLEYYAHEVKLFGPESYIQKVLDYRTQSGLVADPAQITSYLSSTEAENYTNGVHHDPWKEASQQGKIGSYDMSISGRSKFTNYFLSATLVDEKGLVYNDNQKRTSLRANIDVQMTEWLSIGLNSTFAHRDLSGESADLSWAYHDSPYGTWYYPDGAPTKYVVPEDQVSNNSIYSAILTTNKEIYDNLFSNFYVLINIPLIKGLSYRVNYSPNYRWGHNYNFFRQDMHITSNTTSASKFDQKNFDWVLENIVTYKRQIGENHALDFTFLYGRNHYGFESTTATASQLSSDALGFNNLGLGSILTNSSSAQASEGVSSMARLNYQFKKKYLLTLTVRRDGSSVFAVNNKYGTFPSGSLAWIVSDEPFLKKVNFIDMMKFRVSYGSVGNQAINPYQSLSLSSTTQYVFGDGGATSIGVYPSNMGNSDLKWETTYIANAALDFDLFKGRLGGTVEVYNSNTSDLLVKRSIPTLAGFSNILTNLGKVNNKGLEITINSINIQTNKFQWQSNLVFSHNKNTIVHLYGSDTNGDGKEDDDLSNSWFIGQPINSYYDYVFDGIYQEGDQIPSGSQPGFVRLKDLNGDGKIDINDRTIIGSGVQPKNRFGITNNFSYGNLSLSVMVNAMQDWISNFPLLDISTSPNTPGRPVNQLDAGYWTSDNKSNTRSSIVYANPLGHGWYISRNFVRIQDVSLAYNFSKDLLTKLKMSDLRVFMSGKNLFTFTKWLGSDPESGGITSSSFYPMPRIITFGFNMGF